MAEEAAQKTTPAEVQAEEVVVIADVPQPENITPTKEPEPELAVPVPETEEETVKLKPTDHKPTSKPEETTGEKLPTESDSFKEESNRVSDLREPHKKALEELKQLVQEALKKQEFTTPRPSTKVESKAAAAEKEQMPPAVEEQKPQIQEPDTVEEAKLEAEADAEADQNKSFSEQVASEATQEEPVAAPTDATAVEDDGAKTVEAIEETIIAVSSTTSAPQEDQNFPSETKPAEADPQPPEEVFIWGVKLMEDEKSDVILLKFLRARDFKVKEAFNMLKNTLRWRKEFGIDQLLEEENLGEGLENKVVYMHGNSKEGHPVCYNVYGPFQDKELYQKTFSDEEKRQRFLRWRIQFLEKSIRKLDFTPGGISTIVQVNDLKNSPGPAKWELRQATKQALNLLQDNYPEFVAKQVFINVAWWYLAVNRMISPFLTQRTKSKFVFAGPSKSAETLFKYIATEQVPIQYGGLSTDGEFEASDAVTEIIVRPSAKQTVEFLATEACLLAWEVRVVGWDVNYGAEFVPSAKDGCTIIIQKARKVSSSEEQVICSSFKTGEPGTVVLTIDNPSSKKKKLLYRHKSKA